MGINERRNTVENPRAFGDMAGSHREASTIGFGNVANYMYTQLRALTTEGRRFSIDFGEAPEATRSVQFQMLVDLIKADPWMRHVLLTVDDSTYRIVFENQTVVVFS
jgi:hypothetical protein